VTRRIGSANTRRAAALRRTPRGGQSIEYIRCRIDEGRREQFRRFFPPIGPYVDDIEEMQHYQPVEALNRIK
jgi:hypothetical protein